MKKACEKIPKLKLEKYQVGYLYPIWSLISAVCTSDGHQDYIVNILWPIGYKLDTATIYVNEDLDTKSLSLHRMVLKLTLKA